MKIRGRLVSYVPVVAIAVAVATTACTTAGPRGPRQSATATRGSLPSASPSLRNADDQWAANMARCMKDKGWDVTVGADKGIEGAAPNDQVSQYRAAIDACYQELGYSKSPVLTEEEAGRIYDELLRVADCVRALGYPVTEPPSKQAYVEGLLNKRILWHPYQAVFESGPNDAAQRELADKCPIHQPS